MLSTWQIELAFQIAMAATPVAVYFLILGLLNSRRRPQLLSSRLDFSLLLAALSPLCVVPLLRWIGADLRTLSASIIAVAGLIAWMAPKRLTGWVIYNINTEQALGSIRQALDHAGLAFDPCTDGFGLDIGCDIRVSPFTLLRNVSISIDGADRSHDASLERFADSLAHTLGKVEVIASPTAVSFVLIATAMIVAPLALMANRMPEMVRLLTGLLG